MNYIAYNKVTGKITSQIGCSPNAIATNVDVDDDYLEGHAPDDVNYIDVSVPEVIAKPSQVIVQDVENILADGVEKSTFTNVAINTEVFIDDISQGFEVDGTTEITFDTFGEYRIKFVLFPYLVSEFTVNAN